MNEDTDVNDVVELNLEESNDLSFKVSIHGATQKPSAYRLICEATEMSYGFSGAPDDEGNIVFTVPPMEKHLTPESIYSCAVEVLVEGRFFRPIKFDVKFKQPLRCVVESVQIKKSKDEPVSVLAERKASVAKPVKSSAPPAEESFSLAPVRKAQPQKSTLVKPPTMTLREKVEKKHAPSGTGIDDKVMEEIAKSTMDRLKRQFSDSAKDSEGKNRK